MENFVRWVTEGGASVLYQLGTTPLLLVGALIVSWQAIKIGRSIAVFIISVLALVPWALGAFGYVIGYLSVQKVAGEAIDMTHRAEFLKKAHEVLNQNWFIPAVSTPIFLVILIWALRKGKPARSSDFVR
jgi:hypothetical protein